MLKKIIILINLILMICCINCLAYVHSSNSEYYSLINNPLDVYELHQTLDDLAIDLFTWVRDNKKSSFLDLPYYCIFKNNSGQYLFYSSDYPIRMGTNGNPAFRGNSSDNNNAVLWKFILPTGISLSSDYGYGTNNNYINMSSSSNNYLPYISNHDIYSFDGSTLIIPIYDYNNSYPQPTFDENSVDWSSLFQHYVTCEDENGVAIRSSEYNNKTYTDKYKLWTKFNPFEGLLQFDDVNGNPYYSYFVDESYSVSYVPSLALKWEIHDKNGNTIILENSISSVEDWGKWSFINLPFFGPDNLREAESNYGSGIVGLLNACFAYDVQLICSVVDSHGNIFNYSEPSAISDYLDNLYEENWDNHGFLDYNILIVPKIAKTVIASSETTILWTGEYILNYNVSSPNSVNPTNSPFSDSITDDEGNEAIIIYDNEGNPIHIQYNGTVNNNGDGTFNLISPSGDTPWAIIGKDENNIPFIVDPLGNIIASHTKPDSLENWYLDSFGDSSFDISSITGNMEQDVSNLITSVNPIVVMFRQAIDWLPFSLKNILDIGLVVFILLKAFKWLKGGA